MSQRNIRCIDCQSIRELREDELIGQGIEEYRCIPDETSKTLSCIFAVKDCSRFSPGQNDLKFKLKSPGDPKVRCIECKGLDKVGYKQCRCTHHENWDCKFKNFSMQYEDTLGYRSCNKFKKR